HRTCDYWEDADRGSKAARLAWLEAAAPPATARPGPADNPFAPPSKEPAFNPFADDDDEPVENPFAPRPPERPTVGQAAPPKLTLLGRGLAVFGSYAKVLLVDDAA